jgi:hypothetical protein
MGILRFLLIIIAVYLVFRILTRLILPWLVRRSIKKYQDSFYERNPQIRRKTKQKEGDVTVEKVGTESSGNVPDDIGEYIDYEDIK